MVKHAPRLWPLALMAGGIILLLDNFLLIDLDVTPYWPILLVAVGLQLLLRGDIAPSWQAHTFGITRGSVQSAAIEIESGELDVQLRALHRPGRLIAGQYTARSRPDLRVRNNHAILRMQRGQSWWLSLADWDVGLANDLPWSVLVSSHLGQLNVDLHDLAIDRAYVSSGFGGVNITCPLRAEKTIFARSTFGDVRVTLPARSSIHVQIKTGPFGRVKIDTERFTQINSCTYVTRFIDDAVHDAQQPVDLVVTASTVFGSIVVM